MPRVSRTALGLAALLAVPAGAAPDRDFWSEVVSPHHEEVAALKLQLRDAIAAVAVDANADHRAGIVREAHRVVRYARHLDPGDLELLYDEGALADEGGQAIAAQRLLTEYVSRTPRAGLRVEALVRLGAIALRQGRPELAIGPLRQAVAERGERRAAAAATVYLATALDGAGRTGEAIDLLAEAATTPASWEAEDAAIWLALATLYDRDEQISRAFELVLSAQSALGPQFAERMEAGLAAVAPAPAPEIHYARAFMYETAGFLLEARVEWQSYLRLATGARYHARAREHLASIDALLARRRAPGRTP